MAAESAFARYCVQLAWLLESGLPLYGAARTLADDAPTPALQEASRRIMRALRSGAPAGRALVASSAFPRHTHGLLLAADASGQLPPALEEVARLADRSAERRRRMRGALTAPLPAMLATFGTGMLVLTQVVPHLHQAFRSAHLPTSPTIDSVMHGLTAAPAWGTAILALVMIAAAVCLLAHDSPGGRQSIDRAVLDVPLVGPVVWLSNLVVYVTVLAWMIQSGMAATTALRLAAGSATNAYLAKRWRLAPVLLQRGATLTRALSGTRAVPRFALNLVATAEQAGTVPAALLRSAQIAESSIERRVAAVARTLEPMLLLILGTTLALIGLALYTPILHVIRWSP